MNQEKLIELLDKYKKGELSQEEKIVFAQWFHMLGKDIADPLPTEAEEKEWTKTNWNKLLTNLDVQNIQTVPTQTPSYFRWWVAASILLIAGLTLWYYKSSDTENTSVISQIESMRLIEKTNNTAQVISLALEDSSTVLLQPGSTLKYPTNFESEQREVFLTGEAFFQVARNPEKPFLVYTGDIITKVLGTSFTIKAYEKSSSIQVSVKTGKVSVYKTVDQQKKPDAENAQTNALILTPNQQAVYHLESKELTKSLVDNPQVLDTKNATQQLVFQNKPLTEVFAALEEVYGVDISYDRHVLAGCTFTADLSDNSTLQDKLTIICKTMSGSFQVTDTMIVITSKGCN
ncbi:FecR family protein [Xanthocytophaga agilis]|uniref:FecR domain-containing protein n=1 Tax=Xanthocytophaga agilis TaxID=3048010 RepID=A0AAE3RDA9_9BACT|nr:FecR domain-containing protein [Xanthocytophaga agilis]MDJ1506515.1 FecR domain-containing protein [Xanthocytophaga agilis]